MKPAPLLLGLLLLVPARAFAQDADAPPPVVAPPDAPAPDAPPAAAPFHRRVTLEASGGYAWSKMLSLGFAGPEGRVAIGHRAAPALTVTFGASLAHMTTANALGADYVRGDFTAMWTPGIVRPFAGVGIAWTSIHRATNASSVGASGLGAHAGLRVELLPHSDDVNVFVEARGQIDALDFLSHGKSVPAFQLATGVRY